MADGTLITQLLAAQIQSVPSSGRAATGVPPAILSLAAGSFLTGTVIARDAKGGAILRTEKGEISLKTELALKTGSELVLRIENAGEQLKLRIVTVDGKVPQAPGTPPAPSAAPTDPVDVPAAFYTSPQAPAKEAVSPPLQKPDNRNTGSAAPLPSPASETEEWLPATLLKSAMPDPKTAAQLPQGLLQTKENGALLVRLVPRAEAALPAPTASQGPDTPPPAAATSPNPTANPAANSKLYGAYAKQGGAQLSTSSLPPSSPSPPLSSVPSSSATPSPSPVEEPLSNLPASPSRPAAANPASLPYENLKIIGEGKMEALVLRREAAGESLIQTPLGLTRVKLPATLPAQSRILVEIRPALPQAMATLDTLSAPIPAETASKPAAMAAAWPALEEITDAIAASNPSLAAGLMQKIPHADGRLSSSLLFFVSALKGGNAKEWLGQEAVKLLEEKAQGHLLQRLGADFTSLRNLLTETANDNWQTLVFPLAYQGEMQQVQWHVRRERGNEAKAEQQGTRFIVELSLSQLGAMQMDGFVRQRQGALAFDLVVRTTHPLPEDLQSDIGRIFSDAAELTRFQGNVAFQVMWNFPVLPLASQPGFSDMIFA